VTASSPRSPRQEARSSSSRRLSSSIRGVFSSAQVGGKSAEQIRRATASARLTVPTMAVGAQSVGTAPQRQPRPLTDGLTGHLLEDRGHIIPPRRPDALLALLHPFLEGVSD